MVPKYNFSNRLRARDAGTQSGTGAHCYSKLYLSFKVVCNDYIFIPTLLTLVQCNLSESPLTYCMLTLAGADPTLAISVHCRSCLFLFIPYPHPSLFLIHYVLHIVTSIKTLSIPRKEFYMLFAHVLLSPSLLPIASL